jgi:hypothetical protein
MLGEFQAGRAVGRGARIWLRRLPGFLLLGLIVYSPVLVYTAAFLAGFEEQAFSSGDLERITRWGLIVSLVGRVLELLLAGALVHGVLRELDGRPGDTVRGGLTSLVPALGVALLVMLVILMGFVALAIPGLILICMLYPAIPAAVAERTALVATFERGHALTAGHRVQVFGIFLLLGLVSQAITYGLLRAFHALGGDSVGEWKLFVWVSMGVGVVLASLGAAINAVVYHDLKAASEVTGHAAVPPAAAPRENELAPGAPAGGG